jgi:CheY-like chemotaxis protein
MNRQGPLILVEDDPDDQEMITLALADLGISNEVMVFKDSESALKFLYEPSISPFLIVSDINMPKMDGLSFKAAIESCKILKAKSIPFVFLSTASSRVYIEKAYALNAQGFFEKGATFDKLKSSLRTIIDYWTASKRFN